jgi:MFS family permease
LVGLRTMHVFYGSWIVAACMLCSLVGNALGLFGAGVYLHEVVTANGWTTGLVSGAVTLFYVVSALLLIPVGSGIKCYGPRSIIGFGGIALAGGVIEIGHAIVPWEAYLAFLIMGIGWVGLSTTAVATTLAPWFDKHQGRAVSIASLGASVGGIIGAPALLFGITRIGFPVNDYRGRCFRYHRRTPARCPRAAQSPARLGTFSRRLPIVAWGHDDRHIELDTPDDFKHSGSS